MRIDVPLYRQWRGYHSKGLNARLADYLLSNALADVIRVTANVHIAICQGWGDYALS